MIERAIEKFLFASRWLLAPFFIALALALLVLLVKMVLAFYEFILHVGSASEADVILSILGLVDLTLLGSLLVIMIFSGYENFVSRIDPAQHADWPEWMAKINFTGLKLKLMSSIAITALSSARLRQREEPDNARTRLGCRHPPRVCRFGSSIGANRSAVGASTRPERVSLTAQCPLNTV